MCYNPWLVCDKPLGVPAFVKLVSWYIIIVSGPNWQQINQLEKNAVLQVYYVSNIHDLTHCGLVTPYGDWELGQHLFR